MMARTPVMCWPSGTSHISPHRKQHILSSNKTWQWASPSRGWFFPGTITYKLILEYPASHVWWQQREAMKICWALLWNQVLRWSSNRPPWAYCLAVAQEEFSRLKYVPKWTLSTKKTLCACLCVCYFSTQNTVLHSILKIPNTSTANKLKRWTRKHI